MSVVSQKEISDRYLRFNERLKLFLHDLKEKSGHKYPGLVTLEGQVLAVLKMNPSRTLLADTAYPLYNKHRALITNRDPKVFTEHDMANLKKRANLDSKAMWLESDSVSQERTWMATEDMLDLLDDINDVSPFSVDATHSDDELAMQEWEEAQKKSSEKPVSATMSLSEKPVTLPPNTSTKPEKKEIKEEDMAKQVMKSLKTVFGGADPTFTKDLDEIAEKMDASSSENPTEADQETITRVLSGMLEKLTPDTSENDADLMNLSDKEREALLITRRFEKNQNRVKTKYVIGNILGIQSLTETTDPAIIRAVEKETEEEKERQKNPEEAKEFTLAAHFNYKIMKILDDLLQKRGSQKSLKTGNVIFPEISEAYVLMKEKCKDMSTTEIIKAFGEWAESNGKRLKQHDETLFSKPEHPFLQWVRSDLLWMSFNGDTRLKFWADMKQPMRLASMHMKLQEGGLEEIQSIVNGLLYSSGVSFDADASKLDVKQIISQTLFKGSMGNNVEKIKGLFDRMQKDKDKKTFKSMFSLLQNFMPQNGTEEEDDGGESEATDVITETEEQKLKREHSETMSLMAAKLLELETGSNK